MEVGFLAPAPRGERPAQQPARAELVRVEFAPGMEALPDPDVFRRRGAVVRAVSLDDVAPGDKLLLRDELAGELTDSGAGWTLRYGVRVLDRRGRPSPMVVARDLAIQPVLPAPTGLRAEATSDGIRLAWIAPPGEGPFSYNVYRASAGARWPAQPLHDRPLTAPEYLDSAVITGERYTYVVRTALADEPPYRESASSEPREVLAEDRFPPARPSGLVAVQEGRAVRLFWDPNQERDLAGYRVFRRLSEGSWMRVGPDPVTDSLFLDEDVAPGQLWQFAIRAVDRATPPNESPLSEPVSVLVASDEAPTPQDPP